MCIFSGAMLRFLFLLAFLYMLLPSDEMMDSFLSARDICIENTARQLLFRLVTFACCYYHYIYHRTWRSILSECILGVLCCTGTAWMRAPSHQIVTTTTLVVRDMVVASILRVIQHSILIFLYTAHRIGDVSFGWLTCSYLTELSLAKIKKKNCGNIDLSGIENNRRNASQPLGTDLSWVCIGGPFCIGPDRPKSKTSRYDYIFQIGIGKSF